MQDQELFLLTILKFPVILIKLGSSYLSKLTYLPNYLTLLMVDYLLFHPNATATLALYTLTWLPRLALALSALALFCLQFYGIFALLSLWEYSLAVQILGMLLALSALLFLMRKGYLSMIEQYHLTKLKSPLEHAQVGIDAATDIIGIFLAIFNVLMLAKAHKTLAYEYDPNAKNKFVKHIARLIRESAIIHLDIFYVRVMFRVFPWRFLPDKPTFELEKQGCNVLNCWVLVNLVALGTLLDIAVVLLVGWVNIIHPKRSIYIRQMGKGKKKWRITLIHFAYILLQTVQLIFTVVCLPFCWEMSLLVLNETWQSESYDQFFNRNFRNLIKKTVVRIPYLFCLLCVYVLRYKYHRKKMLAANILADKKNPDQRGKMVSLLNQRLTFQCFWEQVVDTIYLPAIILATILKLWNISWLGVIISQDYNLRRKILYPYLGKTIADLVLLPLAASVSFLIILYEFNKPFRLSKQALETVQREYINTISKKKKQSKQNIDPRMVEVCSASQVLEFTLISFEAIWNDACYLPMFYLFKATFLNVYDSKIIPCTTPNLLSRIMCNYYRSCLKSNSRYEFYTHCYERMIASGELATSGHQAQFWRSAYILRRWLLLQKVVLLLLPSRLAVRMKDRTRKEDRFCEFTNEYWYQRDLANAYLMRLFFLIIEIIVTIIGVVVMLPFTLWRLPTFIIVYLHKKKRKYFFPILFRMYKQMLGDVFTLPFKLFAFLIAPKTYLTFVYKTSFRYCSEGTESFGSYQSAKWSFMKHVIYIKFVIFMMSLQIVFITVLWIRIINLKAALRRHQLSYTKFISQLIFTAIQVPPMQIIMAGELEGSFVGQKAERLLSDMGVVFVDSLTDLPYMLLMILVLMTMPWRVNYVFRTIKDMREDTNERKAFFSLLKNFFKDYSCILMSLILLLSVFKTRKALILIKRNFKLNFFIGFLQYSYYKELKVQMVQLILCYADLFLGIIAIVFGWTRADQFLKTLYNMWLQRRQQQAEAEKNRLIHANTVKSGKQLRLLSKMGFYDYLTMTSFLSVPDLLQLRRADKFNYMMTKKEEVWFMRWENCYAQKYNHIHQSYELRCKAAYTSEIKQGSKVITYHDIILRQFKRNVFEERVDLKVFTARWMRPQSHNYWFNNYTYTLVEGYGPESVLPQSDNEDQQFLRLTNQVRKEKTPLDQNFAFLHLFFVRPTEFITRKMTKYFSQNTQRYKKQVLALLIIIFVLASALSTIAGIIIFRGQIFTIDSLIGVKILFVIFFGLFYWFWAFRLSRAYRLWVSLIPFDLYYDFVNFVTNLRTKVYDNIIHPTIEFVKRCWTGLKCWSAWVWNKVYGFFKKVYLKVSEIWKKVYAKVAAIVKKIYNKTKSVVIRVYNFFKKIVLYIYRKITGALIYAKNRIVEKCTWLYDNVLKPLYLTIANQIRKIANVIIEIFKLLFDSVKALLSFIGSLFVSLYQAFKTVSSNINRLYYMVLRVSMRFLLRFGVIGNLVFTIWGLFLMTLPSLIYWRLYQERWYLIVSTLHTMVLIVVGYKHLQDIRKEGSQRA